MTDNSRSEREILPKSAWSLVHIRARIGTRSLVNIGSALARAASATAVNGSLLWHVSGWVDVPARAEALFAINLALQLPLLEMGVTALTMVGLPTSPRPILLAAAHAITGVQVIVALGLFWAVFGAFRASGATSFEPALIALAAAGSQISSIIFAAEIASAANAARIGVTGWICMHRATLILVVLCGHSSIRAQQVMQAGLGALGAMPILLGCVIHFRTLRVHLREHACVRVLMRRFARQMAPLALWTGCSMLIMLAVPVSISKFPHADAWHVSVSWALVSMINSLLALIISAVLPSRISSSLAPASQAVISLRLCRSILRTSTLALAGIGSFMFALISTNLVPSAISSTQVASVLLLGFGILMRASFHFLGQDALIFGRVHLVRHGPIIDAVCTFALTYSGAYVAGSIGLLSGWLVSCAISILLTLTLNAPAAYNLSTQSVWGIFKR
jgi:hypothetical protein